MLLHLNTYRKGEWGGQGMINQNLLTLTEHINRGTIRVGETMDIETVPGGERFTTKVLPTGNKLQEREDNGDW